MDYGYFPASTVPAVPVNASEMLQQASVQSQGQPSELQCLNYPPPQFNWVSLFPSALSTTVPPQPKDIICRLPQNGPCTNPEYLFLQPRPNMAYYLDICPSNCCPRTVYEVPVGSQPNTHSGKVSKYIKHKRCPSSLEHLPEELERFENEDPQNVPENYECSNNQSITWENFYVEEESSEVTSDKSCQTDFQACNTHNHPQIEGAVVTYVPVSLDEIFGSQAVPIQEKTHPKSRHSSKFTKGYCKFCRSNGEPYDVFSSHSFKNSLNETTCPILRNYVCPICGKTGSEAHTQKYCPQATNDEMNQSRYYRKVRNSVGNFRILKY